MAAFLDLFYTSTLVVSKCHSWNDTISIVEVRKKTGNWSSSRREGKYLAKSLWNIAAEKMSAPNRKTPHAVNSNSIDQFLAIEVGISAVSYILWW